MRHVRKALSLLLCVALPAASAHATVGMAEYSWYFHDQPGQWIEWNHGDICPSDAPRKDCILVRRAHSVDRQQEAPAPAAYDQEARGLYLNTLRALLPLAGVWLGLAGFWRRWRDRRLGRSGSSPQSTFALGLLTLVAALWVPDALAVLFPASPSLDGWGVVIGLSFNILILLAPVTLWCTYRRLFPPLGRARANRWARLLLWPVLLLSSLLAPQLLSGPPNPLLFLFPPAMLLNVAFSLGAVWLVSRAVGALRSARRADG